MGSIKRIINDLIATIYPEREYVKIDGSIIASPDRRYCGKEFKDDSYYIKSAEAEAKRLIENFQISQDISLLDIGCGQGRLPIGLGRLLGEINYYGLDVDKHSIKWCNKYINKYSPTFSFAHLDFFNERYNKKGIKLDDDFRFKFEEHYFDIIYLYSVFSHTTREDMLIYLNEFKRILKPGGRVFFTTFVEDTAIDYEVNPKDYYLKISGPLHVVRYNKDYLLSIIRELGYMITKFDHGNETNGQSGLYLKLK